MSGSCVTLRTALTTSNVPFRLQPNWMPPSLMFGHEMFSSIAATPSASDSMRDTSTYSSSVVPHTLTITVARRARSSGSFSSTKRRTPMPCRPIAFSMPAGVSTMRGAGCPSRSVRNRPFDGDGAKRRQVDRVRVFDAVPEAAARGDERVRRASGIRCETERSRLGQRQELSPTESDPRADTGPARHDRMWWNTPSSPRIGTTQL